MPHRTAPVFYLALSALAAMFSAACAASGVPGAEDEPDAARAPKPIAHADAAPKPDGAPRPDAWTPRPDAYVPAEGPGGNPDGTCNQGHNGDAFCGEKNGAWMCMDYDCDGVGHCTDSAHGGADNCCATLHDDGDCRTDFHCEAAGGAAVGRCIAD